jgi:hypothetical protein
MHSLCVFAAKKIEVVTNYNLFVSSAKMPVACKSCSVFFDMGRKGLKLQRSDIFVVYSGQLSFKPRQGRHILVNS